ncbi:MAG: recombinase family protein, partial [Lachnospiraceae bacterium]|nr:recombinase family protein [Lachnospiraceae bacterium]
MVEYAGSIVQDIFSWYKDGMSVQQIADRLNDLGVIS